METSKIKLLFTGDLAPVNRVEKKPGSRSEFVISDSVKDLFKRFDLRITNLECPLTISETGIRKSGPHLKAHPQSINVLKELNIDIACLSNNHIRDFGDEGVAGTMKTCKENEIKTVGAGLNIQEAQIPQIIEIKNCRVAIANFSESEFNYATENRAGSNPDDIINIFNSIQSIRSKADKVIVVMHGGKEMYPLPTPHQMKLYRFIIDIGADAVIGHHSHVIGGYEIYKGNPIVYSLGNFIFDEEGNPEAWYYGAIAEFLVESESIKINFHYTMLEDKQLNLVYENNPDQALSAKFLMKNIDEDKIKKEWDKLIKNNHKSLIKNLLYSSLLDRVLFILGIKKMENDKQKLIPIVNRFRCETHRISTIDSIDFFLNENNNK